ncbi:hypothetical protein BLOT_007471 [Blomia tropicalis]|nr:hypothetical protein BLOT_007471 [Blomia tropicalis]
MNEMPNKTNENRQDSAKQMAENETDETLCRICLNATFDSDDTKLDREMLQPISPDIVVTPELLQQMVSPCKCAGSVGLIHKGCLLLEVQYRRSAICQICKSKYRFVSIWRKNNSVRSYICTHKLRSFGTLLYCLCIPILTTLWFCNKLKYSEEEQAWNEKYRTILTKYDLIQKNGRPYIPPSNLKRTPIIKKNRSNRNVDQIWSRPNDENRSDFNGTSQVLPQMQSSFHPFIILLFSYHCDVLWINLLNLLLIQLIMNDLEHYNTWCRENRPRVLICIKNY